MAEAFLVVVFGFLVALVVSQLRYGSLAFLGQDLDPEAAQSVSRSSGSGAGTSSAFTPQFRHHRNNYLLVYCLMMAGDWMQGPYIYVLYEHYGYHVSDIGLLFTAGFGSSMIFGTIVGSMADRYGRKAASLLYVITYSLSCFTKHSSSFQILLLGRVLGGISCSLLFSTFEAWLIAEHKRRGFSERLLGDIFSLSVFLGSGLVAIVSGLVGEILVQVLGLGPVAPFDAAVVLMVVGGAVVIGTWGENYGDVTETGSLGRQLRTASAAILSDPRIALLGAMQSLFEAAMYTFCFLWTPALSPAGEKLPHGLVFSCFMTACMAGSAATGRLMHHSSPAAYMAPVYCLAALALAIPFIYNLDHRDSDVGSSLHDNGSGGMRWQGRIQLLAFCLFEFCVGIFWPSMMTLRATYVPEHLRATIMNIFRVPLNLFVCLVLCQVSSLPLSIMFGVCVLLLLACAACQLYFNRLLQGPQFPSPMHHSLELAPSRSF